MSAHRAITVCVAGLAAACVFAAPAGTKPPKPPTKLPLEADPLRADHVGKLMEQYDHAAEREAFFRIAGDDGELSQEEFYRSRGRHNRKDAADEPVLIRPYEHWQPAAQHDVDGSGQLNWPEFEKHRAALKKQLLGRFDKDRNGRILGPEREEANDWLRRSIYVRGRQKRPWSIARWDDNDDGKLDPHEQRRREAWLAQQLQAKQRQDELNVWDTNKDGTIDPQERAVMAAELKRQEAERQARIRRWDRDGDGRLDEKETYVMERCEPGDPRQKHELLRRFDRNRDGKLDEKERGAVEKHFAGEYDRQQHQRMLRRYDKNRDGKLDEKERALMAADRRKDAAPDDRK